MQEGPWPQACAAAEHTQSALKQPRCKSESDDSERSSGCGSERSDQISRVQLFATPSIAARQASLSITNFQGLLKLMSTESVMPSNHLIPCCSLLLLPSIFPSIRVFLRSQLFTSGGQSVGVLASASVLPMNVQD